MIEPSFSATTRHIQVTVRACFLDGESDPEENRFFWSYRVTIQNRGGEVVKLLRRTWIITDGVGHVIKVEGPGVVGEQPVLEPGESFEYTSGTPLETPTGFMRGTYHMIVVASGEAFDVEVPAFSLDSPHGRVH